jgi:hypothetical protein
VIVELVLAVVLVAVVGWIVGAPALGHRRRGSLPAGTAIDEAPPLEETRRGQALIAIKDLEFDHATAKIDDEDYATLKARYTNDAIAVLRSAERVTAEGLIAARRAQLDGAPPTCPVCSAQLPLAARFCADCGEAIDA